MVASGEECLKAAIVNVPNAGDAYFTMTSGGKKGFKEMTINAGTNTQWIYLDCTNADDDKGTSEISIFACYVFRVLNT